MEIEYNYTTYSIDPDGDYIIDEFTDYYDPGENITLMHKWNQRGDYQLRVKAIDGRGMESFWSHPLDIVVQNKRINPPYSYSFRCHHLFSLLSLYKNLILIG